MIFQEPMTSLNPVHRIAYHLERPLLLHRQTARSELRGKVEALLDALGAQLDAEPVYRRDEFGRSYTVAVPVLRRQRPERGL